MTKRTPTFWATASAGFGAISAGFGVLAFFVRNMEYCSHLRDIGTSGGGFRAMSTTTAAPILENCGPLYRNLSIAAAALTGFVAFVLAIVAIEAKQSARDHDNPRRERARLIPALQ